MMSVSVVILFLSFAANLQFRFFCTYFQTINIETAQKQNSSNRNINSKGYVSFKPYDGVFKKIVYAVIMFRSLSTSLQFHFRLGIIIKKSTHQQHQKTPTETETATAQGKCHLNSLMDYLQCAFLTFFYSIHSHLNLIFYVVWHF